MNQINRNGNLTQHGFLLLDFPFGFLPWSSPGYQAGFQHLPRTRQAFNTITR